MLLRKKKVRFGSAGGWDAISNFGSWLSTTTALTQVHPGSKKLRCGWTWEVKKKKVWMAAAVPPLLSSALETKYLGWQGGGSCVSALKKKKKLQRSRGKPRTSRSAIHLISWYHCHWQSAQKPVVLHCLASLYRWISVKKIRVTRKRGPAPCTHMPGHYSASSWR